MSTATPARQFWVALKEVKASGRRPDADADDLKSAAALNDLMFKCRQQQYSASDGAGTSISRIQAASAAAGDSVFGAEQTVKVTALNGGTWNIPSSKWTDFLRGMSGALAAGIPLYLTERIPETQLFCLGIDVDDYHDERRSSGNLIDVARQIQADVKKCFPSAGVDALTCIVLHAQPYIDVRKGSKWKHGLHLHFPSLRVLKSEAATLDDYLHAQGHAVDSQISGLRLPLTHKAHAFLPKKMVPQYCATCDQQHEMYTRGKDHILAHHAADDGRPYLLLAHLDGSGFRDVKAEADMFFCEPASSVTEPPAPFTSSKSILALLRMCSMHPAVKAP